MGGYGQVNCDYMRTVVEKLELTESRKQLICPTTLPKCLVRNCFGPKFGHIVISALRSMYSPALQDFEI